MDHSPGQTGQIAAAGYQFTKNIAAFGTRAPMIEGNISRMIRTTAYDPQARQ